MLKVTLDRRDLPAPMGQDALRVEVHIPPKEEEIPLPNMARSAVYTGEWKGSFRDGKGEPRWPDGGKYVGDWLDNKAHG